MSTVHAPPEPRTWFDTTSLPPGLPEPERMALPPPEPESAPFVRLWIGFMSARVLLALAIAGLYLFLAPARTRCRPGCWY